MSRRNKRVYKRINLILNLLQCNASIIIIWGLSVTRERERNKHGKLTGPHPLCILNAPTYIYRSHAQGLALLSTNCPPICHLSLRILPTGSYRTPFVPTARVLEIGRAV